MQDPVYQVLLPIYRRGAVGQRDRWAGSSRATVPCALETGPCTTGRPRPGDGQWGLVVIEELSLKLSPLLSVLVSQASLPLNPQSAPNDPLPWGDSR